MGLADQEELASYNEMRRRVDAFVARYEESPAYDFDRTGVDVSQATQELEDAIRLYAKGGVDERGVEAVARTYVSVFKRPEAKVAGDPNPPPVRGTYPGKVQAAYGKQLSRPAPLPVSLEIERIDRRGAVLQELSPDFWRYAVLLIDYEGNGGLGYFVDKPLKAGAYGYAKYNPHSLQAYADKPELWAVQFYSPDTGISYYFRTHQVEAHTVADHQDALDRAWSKGFSSRK
jgi:hypothetical protein